MCLCFLQAWQATSSETIQIPWLRVLQSRGPLCFKIERGGREERAFRAISNYIDGLFVPNSLKV